MRFWKNAERRAWVLGALAGSAFLVLGAALGQCGAIRSKAVMICLECIGIG